MKTALLAVPEISVPNCDIEIVRQGASDRERKQLTSLSPKWSPSVGSPARLRLELLGPEANTLMIRSWEGSEIGDGVDLHDDGRFCKVG